MVVELLPNWNFENFIRSFLEGWREDKIVWKILPPLKKTIAISFSLINIIFIVGKTLLQT